MTSHELNEWQCLCDKILWLDHGRICFQGSPAQWTSSLPLSIWVGETPVDDLAAIRDENLIHSRIQNSHAQVRLMAEANPDPAIFTEVSPTLEDAYLIRKSCLRVS